MDDLIATVTAVLCCGVAFHRVRTVRRSACTNRAGVALTVALLATSAALLVQERGVTAAVRHACGVADVGLVLFPPMVLVAVLGIQTMLLLVTSPATVARRLRWRVAGTALAITSWSVAVPVAHPSALPGMVPASSVGVLCAAVSAGCLGLGVGDVVRAAAALAAALGPRPVRFGLWAVTGGVVLVGAAALVVVLAAVAPSLSSAAEQTVLGLARTLVVLGSLCLAAGCLLPSWGSRSGWLRPVSLYRLHRTLFPLWLVLHQAVPTTPLSSCAALRWRDRCCVRHLGARLYSRYIDIRDALVALHPYEQPEVTDRARLIGEHQGLTGSALEATVQACRIMLAVDRKITLDARGEEAPAPTGTQPDREPCASRIHSTELLDELHDLAQVATALGSPVVRQVRAESGSSRKVPR